MAISNRIAARLAEIDRAEVVAVLLFRGADAVVVRELRDHLGLRRVVGGAEGDVVHRAARPTRRQETARPRAGR